MDKPPKIITGHQRRLLFDKLRIARAAVRTADRIVDEVIRLSEDCAGGQIDHNPAFDLVFNQADRNALRDVNADVDQYLRHIGIAVAEHGAAPEITSAAMTARERAIRRLLGGESDQEGTVA